MEGLSYWIARARNGVAKAAAGLTPFGESVWPGVRNDLFLAHESIYGFFEGYTEGRRVLDAGCGTGYGSFHLSSAGAVSVLGVDLDTRSIRYARRRYCRPGLEFRVADIEGLDLPEGSFDVIVSSNVLEHLARPERFLSSAKGLLSEDGRLLIALPPITWPGALDWHRGIHYHRSNLTVDEWLALFRESGWSVEIFSHRYPPDPLSLSFRSPFPSDVDPDAFAFVATDRDGVYREPAITAIYVLRKA